MRRIVKGFDDSFISNGNKNEADDVNIDYIFLFLLEISNRYKKISKHSQQIISQIINKYNKGSKVNPITVVANDLNNDSYQRFTIWRGINCRFNKGPRENKFYDIEIKYYKKRILITFSEKILDKKMSILFRKAKDSREYLAQSKFIKMLINEFKENHHQIYMYTLVIIDKQLQKDNIHELDNEVQTTFCYEGIQDPHLKSKSILPFSSGKVFIRLSSPSIITTKLSNNMKNKIINAIYSSGLYHMRIEKKSYLSDIAFEKLRDYMESTLFQNQAATTQMKHSKLISILSIIASFSAFTSSLSLMSTYLGTLSYQGISISVLLGLFFFIITFISLIYIFQPRAYD
jgi:hypothetical protein